MAQKCQWNLFFFNSAAIVCHPDKRNSSLPDFHRDRSGFRVDGIFQKLLHHRGRPLNDLAGRDLVDGILIQYMNVRHVHLPH